MTFGIDISTHQANLDLAAAKAAGAQFVIVKSVASYLPQLTIADDYQSGIDRAIAAGFGHTKGQYAVPNSRNTPAATARFQMSIVYRPAPTDAYMLDNEPLDTYKVYWRDDDAAEYFYTLYELGVRYDQMWFYCPAYLTRANGPWPKIEALRKLGLKIVWVSYGDNDPYREDGEEPLLGGGITGWDVHQFTSTWRVPGYGGNVDGNYSPLSVAELFGGVPVSLEDQMRQFARTYPKPTTGQASWDQMCGSLMYRFNTWRGWTRPPSGDISSAFRAGSASGSLNLDASKAPIGAWHFFDIGGEANGHVVQDAKGGGWRCFSTGYTLGESLGSAIGFVSVSAYVAAKGARYRGWATNYAGGTISVAATAGGGITPIEEDDMFTDEDRKKLDSVHSGLYFGGPAVDSPDPGSIVALIDGIVSRVWNTNVDRGLDASGNPVLVSALQELADAKTIAIRVEAQLAQILARGTSEGGVDVQALAAVLAPAVIDGVLAGIPKTGTAPTAEEIAELTAAKLAARLAS